MTNKNDETDVPARVEMKPAAAHLQLELPIAGGVIIRPTGVHIPETAGKADVEKAFDVAFRMADWATMVQSSLVEQSRERFGDDWVRSILQKRGIQQQEVKQLLRLEAVTVRVPDLTAEHHFAVSKLDVVDQGRWLETAREHGLSAADLRASIRAGCVVRAVVQSHTNGEEPSRISSVMSPQFIGQAFRRWQTDPETQRSMKQWPVEMWRQLRDVLKPIVAFYGLVLETIEEKEGGK